MEVSKDLIKFVKSNSRNESFLFNNRNFMSTMNVDGSFSEVNKTQYEINRNFIINHFK